MEINERIYNWIKDWTDLKADTHYSRGYRDAMRDVLEEIEEFNENVDRG